MPGAQLPDSKAYTRKGIHLPPPTLESSKKARKTNNSENSTEDQDWMHFYDEEPHAQRRRQILLKHPEIKHLFGPNPNTLLVIVACVIASFVAMHIVLTSGLHWWQNVLIFYLVSATLAQGLFKLVHECGHNLIFGYQHLTSNKLAAIFTNAPLIIPCAIAYKDYHNAHHRKLGLAASDTGIPGLWEARTFWRNKYLKLIWFLFQGPFFLFRPLFIVGPLVPNIYTFFNAIVQAGVTGGLFYGYGWQAPAYLLASLMVGIGPHFCCNYIAEHYAWKRATYSYYGALNWLTFNFGYHNEHHDFPYIAYNRLPQVRILAPEFYSSVEADDKGAKECSSWMLFAYYFLTDGDFDGKYHPGCAVAK